ncbi:MULTISPECIES: ComF family protein [unclassified Undibacterium]|uniref:ComF family protein n=1 Tax=unclassified Undibacterium TaxID=2630295 RepID=UPI002AC9CA16|nr:MULTISPECIES: ComF family protein [unclassified Undibacterium]MEB0139022.1 ComF family protein [Undibacterium sp. CCC2.1]MEB0171883.1 ComF family protein [Undibacterium sp. CCC1.1]MEB0175824.1 ComF family protein [Undibacterium sp. CCC3.4]MEB0215110.1 ComF family protein [Undibacterium sp. 5I2]WPX45077.1 ComF family protein [Undibacterium sp. CCC3.4]
MHPLLVTLIDTAVPLLLPTRCSLCDAADSALLCQACQQRYLRTSTNRCHQCALPLLPQETSRRCGACLAAPPAFDRSIVVTDYLAPQDQLVLALKFGQRLALAPLMARLLHQAIRQADREDGASVPLLQPAALLPVPLHRRRLCERGYNQALEIARPLARALDSTLYIDGLQRCRDTEPQSRLTLSERKKNLRHAFLITPALLPHIAGAHLAVVDDVMTSGATLQTIARLLKRHGAASVSNYVFARTPKPDDQQHGVLA